MKKNTMMRIASVLLIAVLMTTCVISGTFAKYTSVTTGIGEAQVAHWAFEVNDKNLVAEEEFEIDLLTTIKDENGTSPETDVIAGKIAPGTTGSFTIKLENLSEVTAQYDISISMPNTSAQVPLLFTFDNSDDDSWVAMTQPLTKTGTIAFAETTTANITVYWKWAYNGNDITDTNLGVAAGNWIVNATITATQAN